MSPWYYLVFTALGLAATTFLAIVSHIPRIPQQRGLLGIIIVSGVAAVFTLMLTQITDPLKRIDVSRTLFDLFFLLMILVILAALLDLFYFVQAQRRRLPGATWSLLGALALAACGTLGLFAHFGLGR